MAIVRRKAADGRTRYLVRLNQYSGDCKRSWATVGTFGTLREAKAAEAAAIAKRDSGYLAPTDKLTVGALLDTWLETRRADLASNTFAEYRITIDRHIKPVLGRIRLDRLHSMAIDNQYAGWQSRAVDPLSPHVVRNCHLRLSAALDYAVRMKLINSNPARDVRAPKLPRPKFDHWYPEEARTFLAAVQSYHGDWEDREPGRYLIPAVLWDLLLREGVRRGEALGLRWRDFDADRGTIHIAQTVSYDKANGGAARIQERAKTKAGERAIRLTAETLNALRERRKDWLAQKLAARKWQETDLIVCTESGGPINPSNVRRSLDAIVATAEYDGKPLRPITTHQLRHTSATLLLAAGQSPKIVSERLGHANVSTTLSTYSHLLPEWQDSAADAMSRMLKAK